LLHGTLLLTVNVSTKTAYEQSNIKYKIRKYTVKYTKKVKESQQIYNKLLDNLSLNNSSYLWWYERLCPLLLVFNFISILCIHPTSANFVSFVTFHHCVNCCDDQLATFLVSSFISLVAQKRYLESERLTTWTSKLSCNSINHNFGNPCSKHTWTHHATDCIHCLIELQHVSSTKKVWGATVLICPRKHIFVSVWYLLQFYSIQNTFPYIFLDTRISYWHR